MFRVEGDRAVLARAPDLLDLEGAVSVPAAKRGVAWQEVRRQTRRARAGALRVCAFIDTNILVRHFTGDPPDQAERATRFLAASDELLLVDLVVAETVYVLESFYEVERAKVAALLRAVIAFPAIVVLDANLLLCALEVYEVDRLDFAEAYLWQVQRRRESAPWHRSTARSTGSGPSGGSNPRSLRWVWITRDVWKCAV